LSRALALVVLLASGCAHRPWQDGVASWYGRELRGRPTASGEPFRPTRLTAAHKTLPFGTVLKVRHGDEHVRVVVNDRGPYVAGRVLDLSQAAARRLGILDAGVAEVRFRVVGCRASYAGPRGCAEAGKVSSGAPAAPRR
jgi:rare lipoprotein A